MSLHIKLYLIVVKLLLLSEFLIIKLTESDIPRLQLWQHLCIPAHFAG